MNGAATAAQWLERLRALPLQRRVKILNVCGGHERSSSMAGLRSALPPVLRDANIALAVLVLVGPGLAAVLTATGVA